LRGACKACVIWGRTRKKEGEIKPRTTTTTTSSSTTTTTRTTTTTKEKEEKDRKTN
jgi:hypothetical protein